MPLSLTVIVPAFSSGTSLIFHSEPASASDGSFSDSNRSLSIASAALLISLAKEDFLLCVERVDDQIEKLFEFGLEFEFFRTVQLARQSFQSLQKVDSVRDH